MRFEAGNLSSLTTATTNSPLVAFRAPATEVMRIREIGITLTAATASRLGLVRATTVSVTPGTTVAGQPIGVAGAPASASLLVSSWGTVPVQAAAYLRRISLPAAIGAGFIWTWPADDPLVVGNGAAIGEVLISNLVTAAVSVFEYYCKWED